jgi:hypothetical protein
MLIPKYLKYFSYKCALNEKKILTDEQMMKIFGQRVKQIDIKSFRRIEKSKLAKRSTSECKLDHEEESISDKSIKKTK